tara:strand:+ start:62 stop:892 length:831 start_codon:yes stop_codon:yes gene_type:complete
MIVLTYATHSDGYYEILKDQCDNFNMEFITLGYGQKWKGYLNRYEETLDYLLTLDENEIVLITDGFDSLLLEDEDTILEKFYKIKKDKWIVYANEYPNLLTKLEFGSCNNKNINAGSLIGRVNELIIFMQKFLEFSKDYKTKDDQVLLTKFCKLKPTFMEMVELDEKNIIFCMVSYSPVLFHILSDYTYTKNFRNIQIKDKKIWEKYTNTTPSVVFGWRITNMDDLVEHLGYDVKNQNQNLWKMIKERWVTVLIFLTALGIICIPIVFLLIKLLKK